MIEQGYWELFNEAHDKVIRIHSPEGHHKMELSWDGGETWEFACSFQQEKYAARTAEMLIEMLGCYKVKVN